MASRIFFHKTKDFTHDLKIITEPRHEFYSKRSGEQTASETDMTPKNSPAVNFLLHNSSRKR